MHTLCYGYMPDQSFENRNIYRWEDVLGAGSFPRWGNCNPYLLEELAHGVKAELVWQQSLGLEEEHDARQVQLFVHTRECSEGLWSSWIWVQMP